MDMSELSEIKDLLETLVVSKGNGAESAHLTSAHLRELEFRLRKMRRQVFPKSYFSDFAWDILMELDKAERSGRRYAVTDAGIEAGISLATTVRYIAKLEKDGYLVRETDPQDRRRCYISLTEKGKGALDHIFDRVVANTPAN